MTSRRPYKDPIPPYKAAQIMVGKAEGNKVGGADLGQDVRDQGMRQCFDEDMLRKFIVFLGHMKLANF
jgi:hypothetical protein